MQGNFPKIFIFAFFSLFYCIFQIFAVPSRQISTGSVPVGFGSIY